jgi:hypothetical protein
MSLTILEKAKAAIGSKPSRTVEEVLPSLTPDLKSTLAILDNAPPGIAELTIATLGLGSRLTLRGLGIVQFDEGDVEGTSLKITKLGREVITECARNAPLRQEVAAEREKAQAEVEAEAAVAATAADEPGKAAAAEREAAAATPEDHNSGTGAGAA